VQNLTFFVKTLTSQNEQSITYMVQNVSTMTSAILVPMAPPKN